MFRLDRIQRATLSDYAEPVSLQGRESAVLLNIFVNIISDPRMVSEIFNLHIPANFTQEDEFETTVFNDEWVIRTISSLKGAAVLSGPDDLRTQIKVRAIKALELYS
jgi:predicted DNA-binding transcriptional regulator YafY